MQERIEKVKKSTECWEHFKLISEDRTVDGVQEYKVVCKFAKHNCSHRMVSALPISIVITSIFQPVVGLLVEFKQNFNFVLPVLQLSTLMYSKENTCEAMVKFVVGAVMRLNTVDNEHFTQFVKEYI